MPASASRSLAADRQVLRPCRVVRQAAVILEVAAVIQSLLQRIEHELGVHRTALAPTHDAPAEHVHHERHVDQPAGRDVGEVRDPELVGPLGSGIAS